MDYDDYEDNGDEVASLLIYALWYPEETKDNGFNAEMLSIIYLNKIVESQEIITKIIDKIKKHDKTASATACKLINQGWLRLNQEQIGIGNSLKEIKC